MSHLLAGLGILIAAAAAAGAILLPSGRSRSAAMLVALVLFPILILGDQWHSHQIADLRHDPSRLVALGALAIAASAALALAFRRWPILLPLAIVAALPFRVPLHAGGDTANLLVPLYLVIAGGVLTIAFRDWHAATPLRPATGPAGPSAWLPRILAAVVVLYAVQVLYSEDFSKGLQNVCFFFVPFSLVYGLLRDVSWDRRLLTLVLWVIGVSAVCFVLVGSIEWVSRSLFWNSQVIRSNEFHTYFRVNSVFWDPNIYGRYLSLVAVVAMSALLWARQRRTLALLTALLAVVWVGLVPTFSQSSYAALLAGLAVLAALRWSVKWTAVAVAASVAMVMLVITIAGSFSLNRINIDTSGRANLVSGGVHLFSQRPVYGYGSGSFPKAYRQHIKTRKAPVSVSHTEPITIAAEQGLLGLTAYVALVAVALLTMASGLRRLWPAGPVAAGDPPPPAVAKASSGAVPPTAPPAGGACHPPASAAGGAAAGDPRGAEPRLAASTVGVAVATGPAEGYVARVVVLATFVALLVHTMAYAGFFEDPIAWVLLAAGASLAAAEGPG